MEQINDFEINYWGKDFSYSTPQKKGRSIGKKITLILLFIVLLTVSPGLIFNLKNFKFPKKELSSTAQISISPTKTPSPTQAKSPDKGVVAKNDSYWKISKRYCGTGKFYLTIQQINDSKPLFEGDSVKISCAL